MISILSQLLSSSPEEQRFMTELVEEYTKLMFVTANRIVKSKDDAEDVVQDSLERLMRYTRKLMSFSKQRLAGYIVITVRNTAFAHLNAKKIHGKYISEKTVGEDDERFILPSTEVILIQKEDRQSFYKVWDCLPEETRTLLESKYDLEKPDEEIAKELGCQASSVRMKLTRAKRKAIAAFTEVKSDDKAR